MFVEINDDIKIMLSHPAKVHIIADKWMFFSDIAELLLLLYYTFYQQNSLQNLVTNVIFFLYNDLEEDFSRSFPFQKENLCYYVLVYVINNNNYLLWFFISNKSFTIKWYKKRDRR